jgi:hypothetical protein
MTDAAVIADSAPAPVDGAPINDNPANFSEPLGSQIPPDAVAKPVEPKAPASLDDSIERAIAKSAAKQAEPAKADAKAVKEPAKAEQPRENGKFAAKDGVKAPVADSAVAVDSSKAAEPVKPSHTAEDAPARFTETAKAKWASADPEIRGEVRRMEKELTEGYQKHRAAAERDGTLNEYHEMAKASGKELKSVVGEYVNMENLLRKDLVGGLDTICQRMGVSIKDVAAHIMGQTPDQNASQQDATIRELKQEIAGLKEQVGGVTKTFQEQREQSTLSEIEKFAKQPEHARFDELADDIAFFMQSGRAKDLPEAYQLAERLNPAPAKATEPVAASSAAIDPPVHPDKGQKSINGAPSSGSTLPSGKKRVTRSLDEALDRAFSSAG